MPFTSHIANDIVIDPDHDYDYDHDSLLPARLLVPSVGAVLVSARRSCVASLVLVSVDSEPSNEEATVVSRSKKTK
jgi:hypothetical protein